jgi:hypothetical protein
MAEVGGVVFYLPVAPCACFRPDFFAERSPFFSFPVPGVFFGFPPPVNINLGRYALSHAWEASSFGIR